MEVSRTDIKLVSKIKCDRCYVSRVAWTLAAGAPPGGGGRKPHWEALLKLSRSDSDEVNWMESGENAADTGPACKHGRTRPNKARADGARDSRRGDTTDR